MADTKAKQPIKLQDDQVQDLIEKFKTIDVNGDGYIEFGELQEALHTVGIKLPAYEVRRMVEQFEAADKNRDKKLTLDEFKQLYADLKMKEDPKFRMQVKRREDLDTISGMSEGSVEGTTHTVKEAERTAFAQWINRNLKDDPDTRMRENPIDPEGKTLYERNRDGILLCKMINFAVPNTIDERAMNKGAKLSVYQKHENHTLALNSAESIGCNIVNIRPDDLEKGKPHLVLGLLWQVIRIGLFSEINLKNVPGLIRLLQDGESIEQLQRMSPETILLRWVNYHLNNSGYPGKFINNFSTHIKDSMAYTYLLHQIAPRDHKPPVTTAPLGERDDMRRAEAMLQEADKLGCRAFVSPDDVVNGYYKLNLAFVANLFNHYPALDDPTEPVQIIEETREEKTYRNWMNSLGVSPYVNHLYSDLCDGLVIFQLYDHIKPGLVNWTQVHKTFNKLKINFEKLENCNYAIELGKKIKFSLVGIGGEDILEGNQTLTLALVWQLMRAYTLSVLTSLSQRSSPITEKEIVEWVNNKLQQAGKKTFIKSFQDSSISDGHVIIDLIDALSPGSINYKLVRDGSTDDERMANATYAVSMARKIGARIYALPEDIVEVKPKMVMTVFATLMTKEFQKK